VTALAVCAALLLAYTYFGYPIAIGLLARLRPRRPAPALPGEDALPAITVCLPVYNGSQYLRAKVDSLLAQDYPSEKVEILLYLDGCSDDSEVVARELAASQAAGGRIRVLAQTQRRGKPTGLNTMRAEATGDLMLLNDIRQPLSPNAIRSLAEALQDPTVGCATGNLVLEGGAGSGVYWRYENWLRKQESAFRGVVGMTGPIAMARRADLPTLPDDVILDDVFIPMKLALAGKRVTFVTAAEAVDTAFEDDREFGRKVRTLAGNYQLFSRMPALLVPWQNPIWFETMSHKILRLAGPWLMLALAVGSLGGALSAGAAAPAMVVLALGQAGFYVAAAVGPRGGRLAGVARTFVVLNLAAVVGLWRYLGGRQRVTW
jgi:cellulose synthase/poly-beta-1,6-N-acetylglucosamine synthase-like glycosyltransferase